MSWRQPAYLFGPSPSDRDMMEEVLELLATDSPNGDDRTASTATSSRGDNNNNNNNHSSLSGFSHSSTNDTSQDDRGSVESLELLESRVQEEVPCLNDHCGEKTEEPGRRAGHEAVQEQTHAAGAVLGVGQQSIPQAASARALLPLQIPQAAARLNHWPSLPIQHAAPFFAGNPGLIAAASTLVGPSLAPIVAQLPVAPPSRVTSLPPRESAASVRKKMRAAAATTTSHVLPNGQRVHVMSGAEFDELRRKLRMQTASRRYRKRKKEESRQQKMRIQELQSELARLQELEMQSRNYQKRSQDSLESELQLHKEEIAELWNKVEDAAKEEDDWVKRMSSHLSK